MWLNCCFMVNSEEWKGCNKDKCIKKQKHKKEKSMINIFFFLHLHRCYLFSSSLGLRERTLSLVSCHSLSPAIPMTSLCWVALTFFFRLVSVQKNLTLAKAGTDLLPRGAVSCVRQKTVFLLRLFAN